MSDLEYKLDNATIEGQRLKQETASLNVLLAGTEAKLLHSQELLEYTQHHAPSQPLTDDQRKSNTDEYERFAGVIQFLGESLSFMATVNKDDSIESRMMTIVNSMAEREQKYAEMDKTLEQLMKENEELKSNHPTLAMSTERTQDSLDPTSSSLEKQKFEATLTRMMQRNEVEVNRLRGELDAARNQVIEKEAFVKSTTEHLEQKVAKLTEERDAAEANLSETKVRTDDLSKALARAEKGKTSMKANRDQMADDYSALKKAYSDLDNGYKDKQGIVADLRKEIDSLQELYKKTKTRSLVSDIEKIKKLTQRYEIAETQLGKIRIANLEKDQNLATLRAKLRTVQEEKNNELKQLGRLQEELASKDLELSSVRSTSAGYESVAKIAERERDEAVQRAATEAEVGKRKLKIAESIIQERESESDFLKGLNSALEEKAADQTARIQHQSDHLKEEENLVITLKSAIGQLQEELEAIQEGEKVQQPLLDEPQLASIKTDPGVAVIDEEMRLDLNRALVRILSFEELITALEDEAAQARRVYEHMASVVEDLRKRLHAMQYEKGYKDDKIKRVERDLERRNEDLREKITELVDCQAKLQEQELRANLLEEERQNLRHQHAILDRIRAEQQEQLDGRERALRRLDEARKMYERVYESRIDTLKEEKAQAENILQAEWRKMQERHEKEMNETTDQCDDKLEEARRQHENVGDALKRAVQELENERDELNMRWREGEETRERYIKDIDYLEMLLGGYKALVNEKNDDGSLAENSESYLGLLGQLSEAMTTIQQRDEDVKSLKRALDDQGAIIQEYSEGMNLLSSKNEMYLRQGQERETDLATEKKTRMREKESHRTQLASLENKIKVLEQGLEERERGVEPQQHQEDVVMQDVSAAPGTTL
ncbi:hypothetical protein BGZ58_003410 [Dissophora ornata]|nr:hypothetical protein BGZ58_003410 [Dissophora ornata]